MGKTKWIAASKLAMCAQLPMRRSLAIHCKLIVVSRRKRAAQNTLPAAPLRRKAKSAAGQPSRAWQMLICMFLD